ncbi:ABC transporter substrate-binding protein [Methylobacterium phyllosphaerae]
MGRQLSNWKRLTSTIPIVAIMSDPIAYGLVTSLSHPGGNVTGASVDAGIDIWVKRIALLKEAVPSMTRVFYVAPDTTWTTAVGVGVKAAAEKANIELVGPPVENPHQEGQYATAFSGVSKRADAILVSSAPENWSNKEHIVKFAQNNRLPALYPYKDYVDVGGLMSHDIDLNELWIRLADQIAFIFKGANAGDLPIYQPRQFRFVINMIAARTIGLQFSQNLIAMADEVID